MRFAIVLLLLAGELVAAPVPKDFKKAGDKELLVGTWKKRQGAAGWFRFAADGTLRIWDEPTVRFPEEYTSTLDVTANPKRMKLTTANGVGGARVINCIYELDGDMLKFAFITNPKAGVPEKVDFHPAVQLWALTRDKAK